MNNLSSTVIQINKSLHYDFNTIHISLILRRLFKLMIHQIITGLKEIHFITKTVVILSITFNLSIKTYLRYVAEKVCFMIP